VNIIKKYRVLFGFIFGFIYLYFFFTVEPNKTNFIPSVILILLGIIIRIISSLHKKKRRTICLWSLFLCKASFIYWKFSSWHWFCPAYIRLQKLFYNYLTYNLPDSIFYSLFKNNKIRREIFSRKV